MPRRTAVARAPIRSVGKSHTVAADAKVQPIKRQTLTDMTLDAIRDGILRGRYGDGAPLRQDAIADQLGVSRIPVREALRQLEAEGLVTFVPHRGAVVSTLPIAEIAEMFELRAAIECDLLRYAIPNMTAEEHAHVNDVLTAYEAVLHAGEISAWGTLNWQFHSALYAPSHRQLTLRMVANLHQRCDRYLRMQLALTHGETRARDEHRAIAAAAQAGDIPLAVRLMRSHILGAGRTLIAFLTKQRAKGVVPAKGRSS